MNLKIYNLKLHNFLSFADAEIQLNDRGYCLLSGINRNPKDNASSNGSGKSSLINAICWCLTGETIQGTSKDIANIYLNQGCWVELTFTADGDSYKITRYRDDPVMKTDLKIEINGRDESGKGLRESENLLKQYLPDLTSDLIGSVILLGQGLPHKFSDNTPAGRKEVLEQLSKSDFMIQDIKNRIEIRSKTLSDKQRIILDELIQLEASKKIYNEQLEQQKKSLQDLSQPKDFDSQISRLRTRFDELDRVIPNWKWSLSNKEKELEEINKKLLNINNMTFSIKDTLTASYSKTKNELQLKLNENQFKQKTLLHEIEHLKSIKDICPTCGQKIPGVIKQDTSKQEKELQILKEQIEELNKQQSSVEDKYNTDLSTLNTKCREQSKEIDFTKQKVESIIKDLKDSIEEGNKEYSKLSLELARVTMEKENHIKQLVDVNNKIKELTTKISDIDNKTKQDNEENIKLQDHIDVVDKMNSLVKREFRGFLLANIIDFISKKAKEYCQDIFGTQELTFALNGNNIDIKYCNKNFESLSGGEKQKVDLILQFAIRDMMVQHLGFSSNVLALDEIFDALDPIGCDNVLNLISRKLGDIESVFIISHHASELSIPYDSQVVVVKDTNGISHIE